MEYSNETLGDGDKQSVVVTEILHDACCEIEVLNTVRR
jgi:hypothetical protein